jgi:hypothetical protein
MIRTRSIFVSFILVIALLVSFRADTRAQTTSVIDFEGMPEGAIVDSVYSGYGISGEPVSGAVYVYGYNPAPWITTNAAMIFDATCTPGGTPDDCSGEDYDLFQPEWGNILIISEDLDSTDPDDGDLPESTLAFVYAEWGTGSVTVKSIGIQDIEEEEDENAKAFLYACDLRDTVNCDRANPYHEVDLPHTGNGNSDTVFIDENITGIVSMLIDLEGSGAIDNIEISSEPTAVELKSFQVESIDAKQVKIAWETAAEIDNFGFNLYRSQDHSLTQAEVIHFEPAVGGVGGNRYAFIDNPPASGRWYYWLSDIDTYGKETFHGVAHAAITTGLSHHLFIPVLVSSSER